MLRALASISTIWMGMITAAGFAFLSQVLLARSLPLEDYGLLAAVMNLMLMMVPLSTLDVGAYWLRQFGKDGWAARRWINPSIRLVLIATTVSIVLVVGIAWAAWPSMEARRLVLWLLPVLIMHAFYNMACARLQLEERYYKLAVWRTLPHLSRFFVVLTVFMFGWGLMPVAVGYFFSALFVALLSGILTWPLMSSGDFALVGHGPMPSKRQISQSNATVITIMREIWPFALGSFFGLIYLLSDVFLLAILVDNETAGIYNVAFAVMAAIYLLPTAIFHQYLQPKFHRWAEHDPVRLLEVFRFGNASMLCLGLCIMVALLLVAPFMIPWIFGDNYHQTVDVLLWLSLCLPVRFLASSVGGCLVTQTHMRRKVRYQGGVAIFNVLINLLLIPHYQAFGAAAATVLSEILLMLLYLVGVRRHVFGPPAWRGWHLNWKRLDA